MIIFACTQCGRKFEIPEDKAGRKGQCLKCGAPFVVPAAASPPAEEVPRAPLQWMALSADDQTAETLPPPIKTVSSDECPEPPRPPIDYARIVLSVLNSYGSGGGLPFLTGVPPAKDADAAGACALPEDGPPLALLACRRSSPSRTCILFTNTGVSIHTCREGDAPSRIDIPYSEFPSRRFAAGSDATEVALDNHQSLNASGCSVPAAGLIGVLLRVKNSIEDEQKARGEYVPPAPASEPANESTDDTCPRCNSRRVLCESSPDHSTGAIVFGALLFGWRSETASAILGGPRRPHYRCLDCGCEWTMVPD